MSVKKSVCILYCYGDNWPIRNNISRINRYLLTAGTFLHFGRDYNYQPARSYDWFMLLPTSVLTGKSNLSRQSWQIGLMPLLVWAKCPTYIQEQRPGNWRKDPSLLLAYSICTWEKPVILRYNTTFLLRTRKAITCTSSPRCSLSGRPCLKKRNTISELPHSLPGLLDTAFSLNYEKFTSLIKGFSFYGAELVG